MATLEMPHVDIESGRRISDDSGGATNDEEDGNPNFSDVGCSDCSVDVESGENKVDSETVERECRICQLSLFSSSPVGSSGVAIDLGCSCKDDLASAHKHCAETWFKIKGNKICEICNSIAQNVIGAGEIECGQQGGEISGVGWRASGRRSAAARRCLYGYRFLNFMLGCVVFAFILSWLFHFKIPS